IWQSDALLLRRRHPPVGRNLPPKEAHAGGDTRLRGRTTYHARSVGVDYSSTGTCFEEAGRGKRLVSQRKLHAAPRHHHGKYDVSAASGKHGCLWQSPQPRPYAAFYRGPEEAVRL